MLNQDTCERYARWWEEQGRSGQIKHDANGRRKGQVFEVPTDPRTVTAQEAEGAGFVQERTMVLGVVMEGSARVYPIPTLGWHELVNDTVHGIPIAVSW